MRRVFQDTYSELRRDHESLPRVYFRQDLWELRGGSFLDRPLRFPTVRGACHDASRHLGGAP